MGRASLVEEMTMSKVVRSRSESLRHGRSLSGSAAKGIDKPEAPREMVGSRGKWWDLVSFDNNDRIADRANEADNSSRVWLELVNRDLLLYKRLSMHSADRRRCAFLYGAKIVHNDILAANGDKRKALGERA
jgi:hypothetical protein